MDKFPCIICEGGDVYSNIVCDDCQSDIDFNAELFESMEVLVRRNNDLLGDDTMDISDKVREEVRKIYNQLNDLKIEGKDKTYKTTIALGRHDFPISNNSTSYPKEDK